MKNKLAIVAVVGSILTGLPQVDAVPITGQLDMGGTVNLNSPSLGSATAVASFGSDVFATPASDGVFENAGLAEASVTINGFDFTNFSAVSPLWTLSHDGDTFAFNLTGLQVLQHTGTFLDIIGTGTLTSNNYESSNGTFSFTISDSDGVGAAGSFRFGFQATTSATGVPDAGATLGLLGLGLLGLTTLKRRISS